MIYRWIKIDITQDEDITEAWTFTVAAPNTGCLISVVKMMLTSYFSNLEDNPSEVQVLFGNTEKTGMMNLDGMFFNLDLSQYHEVLSGEVDEPLRIKTTCSSVQGFALISESEG